MTMKKRYLLATLTCFTIMLCAVSFTYAAPQCSIVPGSIPWDQGNQSTWVSDVYQLTIQCTDNGSPVEGYQAKFSVSLMKGTNWEKNIATLTVYSTTTDSTGTANIIVPLIHLQNNDGTYTHICPFDDIQCTGGELLPLSSQAAPRNFSKAGPLSADTPPGCLNTNTLPGCCETTITVACCVPNRIFTYCTTTTVENCTAGTTHPDPCTTITTTWKPDGICDYCTGQCGETVIALSSFTAQPGNGSVTLNWTTEAEMDNAGFNILRAESENGEYVKINAAIIPSKAGAAAGASYQFIDSNAQNRKTYFYKLEDIDVSGTAKQHGPQSATPKWIYSFWK
jgi:hypothetical protein